MSNDPIAINGDNRRDVSAKKTSGFAIEKVDRRDLNQIIFKSVVDHVWGTSSQVTANEANFYTDASGNPLDKTASAYTIESGDKILIRHNATLAADLTLLTTAERLNVEMHKGTTLNLGDAGGGVPYLFQLELNRARLCDIYTTQDFTDLSTLTDEQQRVVKNRGEGNVIRLNNRQIFSGSRPTPLDWPTVIDDPYVISQNGFSYEGFKVSGSNDDVCLFTDWWNAWKGLDIVGDGTILIPPVFNPASGVLQRKVFSDDPAGRFLRYNTPFGGSTGVDPDVHSRTSPSTLATIASYTSSASAEISDISDADAIKLKIGARVADVGLSIPQGGSGPPKTTIISSIVHTTTDDNSIFLIDSETGGDAVVSATGNLTIDMSGNSGVSQQLDAFQGFGFGVTSTFSGGSASLDESAGHISSGFGGPDRDGSDDAAALTYTNQVGVGGAGGGSRFRDAIGDDGTNGTPRTGLQTQPVSGQRHSYIIL